jgi:hypothetical protein
MPSTLAEAARVRTLEEAPTGAFGVSAGGWRRWRCSVQLKRSARPIVRARPRGLAKRVGARVLATLERRGVLSPDDGTFSEPDALCLDECVMAACYGAANLSAVLNPLTASSRTHTSVPASPRPPGLGCANATRGPR